MSKQLSISAAFSSFAMAAFAILAAPHPGLAGHDGITGAPTAIEAPAMIELPNLSALKLLDN